MKIYPAIDILDGRCVRLLQGKKDQFTDYGDPVEMALKWQNMGANYLHIVDLNAAFSGVFENKETVRKIVRSVKIPVQMGGGIRTQEDITERLQEVGVSRVVIGTAAVENIELLKWAKSKFGDRIAVGIDAKNGKVVTKGWVEETDVDAVDLALQMHNMGIDTIIYTDTLRDGMLSGPNIEWIERLVKKTWMNIIASGGVKDLKDLEAIKNTGACGVILGRSIYEGTLDFKEALENRR